MKKGDIIWLTLLAVVALLLALPATHEPIMAETRQHPLIAGFVKFLVLATMGDLLALRIVNGKWQKPVGLIYRSLVWGIIGIGVAIVFEVFSKGVTAAINGGLLPVSRGHIDQIAIAFWISTVMNVTFGPMLMVFHRYADTFIDLADGQFSKFGSVSSETVVKHIDWQEFVCFVLKIQLFLWIPLHTTVFLLPPVYRVLAAASLSIVLGGVLGYAKSRKGKPEENININLNLN
ncbi:MAG: hypothetical protein H6Q65_2544 [Firmicutes bacterium]|nr:hypothetical protein [Bacillota bacterium]